jgi:NADH-quinone oxidoreductase subunit K
MNVPVGHALIVAAVLLAIGLFGVIVRRNVVLVLMSIEIMFNAAGLAFVAAGSARGADGQVMFLLILTLAAAEVSVGLALVLQLYRRFKTLDVSSASSMKG